MITQFRVDGSVLCKLGEILVIDGNERSKHFVRAESESDFDWDLGHILEVNSDWLTTGKYPYLIQFQARCLKFWGTAANMKEGPFLPVSQKSSKIRFKIGQR